MERNDVMTDSKPKSIIVDSGLHYKFKIMCKGKNLKIGAMIEDLMGLYLSSPSDIQKMIDKNKGF